MAAFSAARVCVPVCAYLSLLREGARVCAVCVCVFSGACVRALNWVVGSNSLALRYGIRPSQHLNITSYYERRQARALENFYALDTAAHAFSMEKTALPTEFRTSPERSPRFLHTGRGKGLRLCWARAAGVRVPVQQT